jgi:YegS/Rv2252/BmrU family lipid kinase
MDQHTVVVIVNPTARNMPRRKKLLEQLNPLIEEGHKVELHATTGPGDAIDIARQAARAGATRIAACGGDGTLNEVINGVSVDGPAIGVLPTGTGNVWAKEVGVPRDVAKAARLLVEGPVRRVDLGEANGRRFILMCGLGLDGVVTGMVKDRMKRWLGSTSYVVVGLNALRRFKPLTSVFELDGEPLECTYYLALIANSRSYGGVIDIARRAFVDDGLLDVCIYGGGSLARLARHSLRIALGTQFRAKDILYRRVRTVRLNAPGVRMQLDGDFMGESPVEIKACPRAVRMVVPDGARSFAHPPHL